MNFEVHCHYYPFYFKTECSFHKLPGNSHWLKGVLANNDSKLKPFLGIALRWEGCPPTFMSHPKSSLNSMKSNGETTKFCNFSFYLGQIRSNVLSPELLWRLTEAFIAGRPQFNFFLCSMIFSSFSCFVNSEDIYQYTSYTQLCNLVYFLGTWPKTVGGTGGPRNQSLNGDLDLEYQLLGCHRNWHQTGFSGNRRSYDSP